jgi:hypothetical protein
MCRFGGFVDALSDCKRLGCVVGVNRLGGYCGEWVYIGWGGEVGGGGGRSFETMMNLIVLVADHQDTGTHVVSCASDKNDIVRVHVVALH